MGIHSRFLVIVLVLVSLLVGGSSVACQPAAPATSVDDESTDALPSITLRMQMYDPPGSTGYNLVVDKFVDALHAMSGGKVVIEPYGADAIVPVADTLSAAGAGTIDIVRSNFGYWGSTIPEAYAVSAVRNAPSWRDMGILMHDKGLLETCREAYAVHNVYLVSSTISSAVYSWYATEVSSVADLQGMKVRGFGDFSALFEKLGASPVSLPHSESYMALQLGTVEGYISGLNRYVELSHFELCPFVLLEPLGFGMNDIIVNTEVWDGLPESVQAMIHVAAGDLEYAYGRYNLQIDNEVILNPDAYGATLLRFSTADVATMNEAVAELWDDVAARSPGASQIIDVMKEHAGVT